MADALAEALRRSLPALELKRDEPLKNHTSFCIGGPAKYLLLPASRSELAEACALLRKLGERPLVLGNGTNVLAPDEGIDGVVIVTRRSSGMERQGESLRSD